MKANFDLISIQASRQVTRTYSTSFSLGIRFLDKSQRDPIHSIYGFVRLADEIVDTFHEYNKQELLDEFRRDTWLAIERGISLNPVLNSFQFTVNKFKIDPELITAFLHSMEMDLDKRTYTREEYEHYILGSAEVVGLMCLKIFVNGDQAQYESLKPQAMKLGSAFQKINFLRDLCADYEHLGRTYFPGVDLNNWDEPTKRRVEEDIRVDFEEAFKGIKRLPRKSRLGVYVAYIYYYALFRKIQALPCKQIMDERVRIPNRRKFTLFFTSYLRHSFNLL